MGTREEDLGREVGGFAGIATGSTERSMINFVVKRPYKRIGLGLEFDLSGRRRRNEFTIGYQRGKA